MTEEGDNLRAAVSFQHRVWNVTGEMERDLHQCFADWKTWVIAGNDQCLNAVRSEAKARWGDDVTVNWAEDGQTLVINVNVVVVTEVDSTIVVE